MEVFFSHLPAKTSRKELYDFAMKGAKLWWPFSAEPDVTEYEIIEILDPDTDTTEYHGIVNFRSPEVAERVIQKMNGKTLSGRSIEVREFVYRSPGDRRFKRDDLGINRPEEHRRNNLQVTKRSKSPKSSGYVDALRTHGGG
jgi:RNA recognition motif-containing protein